MSTDLRKLSRRIDPLDPAGITSLLLLGAAVPPLTPYMPVRALPAGFRHTFDAKDGTVRSEPAVQWSSPLKSDATIGDEAQSRLLAAALDQSLQKSCPSKDPVILFSGGVDSGIMAARVAALGWKKASLLHCCLGEHDPETEVAKSMASALGVPFEAVLWNPGKGFEVLEKAAGLYIQPFCDPSCVPTHALSLDVVARYGGENRTVLDGTGADGAFGLFGKAAAYVGLFRIPKIARRVIGAAYDVLQLWTRANRLQHVAGLLRRASQMPILPCSIALHPLLDIGFCPRPADLEEVFACCEAWIKEVARSTSETETVPLLDIGLVCAGIYAQKNRGPLMQHALNVQYPYLRWEIVDLALQRVRFWPGSGHAKSALKRLLAAAVPHELVYRPKRGFVAPLDQEFGHPVFMEHLRAALDASSPLRAFIDVRMIARMMESLRRRKTLPIPTYNFLWAVAFTNTWLKQAAHE